MPAGPAVDCAAGEPVPQALFGGTTEVVLGPGAVLALRLDPGPARPARRVPASHGADRRGATLHWALAQLGGRVVRSRIDNRLEGDGSEVEQVEIVFGGATSSST